MAAYGIGDRDPHLWLPRLRTWAGHRLRAQLEEPYASILAGALWGERHALPPDLRAEFQDTGTVHILVTAGLHLGVVGALATGLLTWCRLGRVGSSAGAVAGVVAEPPVLEVAVALGGEGVHRIAQAALDEVHVGFLAGLEDAQVGLGGPIGGDHPGGHGAGAVLGEEICGGLLIGAVVVPEGDGAPAPGHGERVQVARHRGRGRARCERLLEAELCCF